MSLDRGFSSIILQVNCHKKYAAFASLTYSELAIALLSETIGNANGCFTNLNFSIGKSGERMTSDSICRIGPSFNFIYFCIDENLATELNQKLLRKSRG
jgi:hypothetical protein